MLFVVLTKLVIFGAHDPYVFTVAHESSVWMAGLSSISWEEIYIHLFKVGESVQHFYSWRAHPIKFTKNKNYTETSAHKIRLKLKYPTIKSKIKIPNK